LPRGICPATGRSWLIGWKPRLPDCGTTPVGYTGIDSAALLQKEATRAGVRNGAEALVPKLEHLASPAAST